MICKSNQYINNPGLFLRSREDELNFEAKFKYYLWKKIDYANNFRFSLTVLVA